MLPGLHGTVPQSFGITNEALDYLFQSAAFFFLIFARLIGVFVQAPLFGRPKGIPMPIQIGYSLVISFLMYHILPVPKDLPDVGIMFVFTVMGQVLIGLMIGFASYMVAAGIQFAGELMDIQLGLSIAATLDPGGGGGNVNLIRTLQFRLAILVWVLIHGDYFFFKAVERSYELIPVTHFFITGAVIEKFVEMTSGLFVMALEISAPVLVAIFITDVALGLLNRAAHQFNVFMISFPVKILVGMGMITLSLSPLLARAIPNLYSNLNHDMIQVILALK